MKYTDDTDETGTRYITGHTGGRLIFAPGGAVRVLWVWTAAVAADHATGKRNPRKRFTVARPGQPPTESETLRDVLNLRRDADYFKLSEDARAPESRDFSEIHRPLAWRMLRAIAAGDADALRDIAEAVEFAAAITSDAPLNKSPWCEIADAIRRAAESKQDIPTRAEVTAEFNRTAGNQQVDDIRERLARMGFSWLPAPSGRPGKR